MPREMRGNERVEASGREAEVGRLLQALEASRRLDESTRVCFLRGPAGIGRSFVLAAFAKEARARGITPLSGAAVRGNPRPYGLFADLLPSALEILPTAGVSSHRAGDLARRTIPLAGRIVTPVSEGERTAEDKRLDLFDAVAEVLMHLGQVDPPIVMLDDVDAADGASLELLRYLLAAGTAPQSQRSLAGRALWVVSFRDEPPLPAVLADIVARTPALTLPLDGLDHAGLRAFLSRPATVDRILDTTGGVPERIEALLSAGSERGLLKLLSHRLDGLGEVARRALTIVAAFGRPVEPAVVEQLLREWTGDSLGAAIEELVAARLAALRSSREGPRLILARASEGSGSLDKLSRDERRSLHEVIGAFLANNGADPVEVAHHQRIADPSGAGFEWTIRAGEALAARLAYGEAAEAFVSALRVLDDPEDVRAVALYERLAELHSGLSEYPQALKWLGRLKRACRADQAKLRWVKARVARACLAMGRARLAARICCGVLGAAEDASDISPEIVSLWLDGDSVGPGVVADLVEASWNLGRYDFALSLCQSAISILEAARPGHVAVVALLSLRNTLGKLRLHRGDYESAREEFRRSADKAESFGLSREHARALNNLGVVLQRQGLRREALEYYRASLVLRERCGDRAREAFAFQNIAALYHETGALEEALEHYHRALGAFTRSRNAAQVARTASNLSSLYLFLGDVRGASDLLELARGAADEVSDPYLQGYSAMIEADLKRAIGDKVEARRRYEEAITLFRGIDSPRYAVETRLSLAGLFCEQGEIGRAAAVLEEAETILADRKLTGLAASLHLAAAELAVYSEDLETASKRLALARELLLEAPDLEGPVRLYHLMARVATARGDHSGAEASLARAQHLLDELAARAPESRREAFLSLPRRREVLDGLGTAEITPSRVRSALALDSGESKAKTRGRPKPARYSGITGKNERLLKILSLIPRVASVTQPVLIRGPSGSGKELIADAIHRDGPRRDQPFIKVNCAAMHEDLLLSELFGHEKGAFTGAHQLRKGRFELADGGTLFLDEIGDISPKVQVALLRVMQEQAFERVGGARTLRVDVRVVCATNRNLERMISVGAFREDLYYRLKGVMLEVPGLGDRIDDLPELVEHFLQKCSRERGELRKTISPEVMTAFKRYSWPGNIRELEQVIQSVSLFAEGSHVEMCDLEHHPELFNGYAELVNGGLCADDGSAEAAMGSRGTMDLFEMARSKGLSLKDLKREVEESCIRRALEEASGNISEAARLLGMTRSRLSQIVNASEELKDLAVGK